MFAARRFLGALALVAVAVPAAAQSDEVGRLIELVERRPSGMDRDQWRQERRDAAERLGELGDARAVPVLVEVVRTERFDAIAGIAIRALGEIGDPRAAEVLREVAADRSRDRFVRDDARAALAKLGVSAEVPEAAPPDDEATAAPAPTAADEGDAAAPDLTLRPGSLLGQEVATVREGPRFDPDTLAAGERLTFALGGVRLQYDTVRDAPSLDGDVEAHYERLRERERMGTLVTVDAAVAAGAIDYDGQDSGSRALSTAVGGAGEARFYTASQPIFAIARGAVQLSFDHIKVSRPGPDNTTSETALGGDASVLLGGGYGRVFDVGAALRLRRIEMVLRERRALGRPIPADLAERIFRAWWALRGELGAHDRLVATVAILREAGVLLGEPDASTTYELLEVLRDGSLEHRVQGFYAYAGIGETLSFRDDDLGLPEGRSETLLAAAEYGSQSADGTFELVGAARARYRVLADEGEPQPWLVSAEATWRRFRYGEHLDPTGALELGALVGASDDGGDDTDAAFGVGARVGWLWIPNRASRYRLAGSLRYESGELFFGASFEVAHGLLDATFVGAPVYSTL